MAASLAACSAKLDRATEHLDALRTEQKTYLASEPIQLSSHFESETGWWVFTAACSRISLRYSNIVGDCLNNLRSALDQLVSQLVIANGAPPGRGHQFPITASPATFTKAAKTMLAGVSDSHRAIIEAAQPYLERTDGSGRPHALTVLNDLSNRDKHRLINAVTMVIGSTVGAPIVFGGNDDAGPLGDIRMLEGNRHANGEEFARVHISPVGPEPEVMVVRGQLPAEIVFVDWGLPVIPTLFGVARQAARILDHFEPLEAVGANRP